MIPAGPAARRAPDGKPRASGDDPIPGLFDKKVLK